MIEREVIDRLIRGFPRSGEQVNAPHESDAEILRLGDGLWAVTTDDFSPQEDLFFQAHPRLIGWNVAAATLSDLLCVGATPHFYLHAVSLPPGEGEDFLDPLREGVLEALTAAGCFLIGGDVGRADPWRYVGTAMGVIETGRPLTRQLPSGRHDLWLSGPLGGANVAAAAQRPPPPFPLPMEVARVLRDSASACMDTSGGFCEALWAMSQASPGHKVEIRVPNLPLAPEVAEFGQAQGIRPEAALLGGAGEYVLFFAVPGDTPPSTRTRLERLGCRLVGRASDSDAPGVALRLEKDRTRTMKGPPPCPREAPSMEGHIREVAMMAQTLFGEEEG